MAASCNAAHTPLRRVLALGASVAHAAHERLLRLRRAVNGASAGKRDQEVALGALRRIVHVLRADKAVLIQPLGGKVDGGRGRLSVAAAHFNCVECGRVTLRIEGSNTRGSSMLERVCLNQCDLNRVESYLLVGFNPSFTRHARGARRRKETLQRGQAPPLQEKESKPAFQPPTPRGSYQLGKLGSMPASHSCVDPRRNPARAIIILHRPRNHSPAPPAAVSRRRRREPSVAPRRWSTS